MARNYFVFMYSAMTPDSEVTDLNYTTRNTKPKAENIFSQLCLSVMEQLK
jgi:hypothetical protein